MGIQAPTDRGYGYLFSKSGHRGQDHYLVDDAGGKRSDLAASIPTMHLGRPFGRPRFASTAPRMITTIVRGAFLRLTG